MCGVAGYIGSKKLPEKSIEATLQQMQQRGPDAQKWQSFQMDSEKFCYLLHSRLSILDLDVRADQPFRYKNKTIVFNGEIYNYLEIKAELIELGHFFYTKSDTEILIHALEQWGREALDKIEGMWAFAMYDHAQKTVTLCRDRFGEKPLYVYEESPGEIYFSSEVKFLSTLCRKKFAINEDKVALFLVNGYKSIYKNNETFFKDIECFPAATIATYQRGVFTKNAYWGKKFKQDLDISIVEACDFIRELVIQAVKIKLRSDVPLAFCLSGGVDSNSVISIAKKLCNYDVHAFSILSADEKYDEKEDIFYSVKELGLDCTYTHISDENFLKNLEEIVSYHSAPVFTLTYYMNWQLYRAMAEKKYRVAVMVTGGDEIFSGYYDHHNFYLADMKENKVLHQESYKNWCDHIQKIVRNPYLSDPDIFIKNPQERKHIYLKNETFSNHIKNNVNNKFFEKNYKRNSLLKNRMLNELFDETVPVSLNQDDLNCMHFSIENRSPFLSRKLVEFVQQLPINFYIQNGYGKYLLRNAMRGIVPEKILQRREKLGLNTSVKKLIHMDHGFLKSILKDSPIYRIVNRDFIQSIMGQEDMLNSDSKFLFSFLSAKIFLEQNA